MQHDRQSSSQLRTRTPYFVLVLFYLLVSLFSLDICTIMICAHKPPISYESDAVARYHPHSPAFCPVAQPTDCRVHSTTTKQAAGYSMVQEHQQSDCSREDPEERRHNASLAEFAEFTEDELALLKKIQDPKELVRAFVMREAEPGTDGRAEYLKFLENDCYDEKGCSYLTHLTFLSDDPSTVEELLRYGHLDKPAGILACGKFFKLPRLHEEVASLLCDYVALRAEGWEPEAFTPEKITPEKITPEKITPEKVAPDDDMVADDAINKREVECLKNEESEILRELKNQAKEQHESKCLKRELLGHILQPESYTPTHFPSPVSEPLPGEFTDTSPETTIPPVTASKPPLVFTGITDPSAPAFDSTSPSLRFPSARRVSAPFAASRFQPTLDPIIECPKDYARYKSYMDDGDSLGDYARYKAYVDDGESPEDYAETLQIRKFLADSRAKLEKMIGEYGGPPRSSVTIEESYVSIPEDSFDVQDSFDDVRERVYDVQESLDTTQESFDNIQESSDNTQESSDRNLSWDSNSSNETTTSKTSVFSNVSQSTAASSLDDSRSSSFSTPECSTSSNSLSSRRCNLVDSCSVNKAYMTSSEVQSTDGLTGSGNSCTDVENWANLGPVNHDPTACAHASILKRDAAQPKEKLDKGKGKATLADFDEQDDLLAENSVSPASIKRTQSITFAEDDFNMPPSWKPGQSPFVEPKVQPVQCASAPSSRRGSTTDMGQHSPTPHSRQCGSAPTSRRSSMVAQLLPNGADRAEPAVKGTLPAGWSMTPVASKVPPQQHEPRPDAMRRKSTGSVSFKGLRSKMSMRHLVENFAASGEQLSVGMGNRVSRLPAKNERSPSPAARRSTSSLSGTPGEVENSRHRTDNRRKSSLCTTECP